MPARGTLALNLSGMTFKKAGSELPKRKQYKIVVDYDRPLEELISDGKFQFINSNILSRNFPVRGKGKKPREMTLVAVDRARHSEAVIKEMEKNGYRPADIAELLAFGNVQPNLQEKSPIVSLGSAFESAKGTLSVPYLGRAGSKGRWRTLLLTSFNSTWPKTSLFAAVRRTQADQRHITIMKAKKTDRRFVEQRTVNIVVDSTRSLKELISAGKFTSVDSLIIPKHFPLKKNGKRKCMFVLVRFDRKIHSGPAMKEMKKAGLRPARIEELLAFCGSYRERKKQLFIVALGSSFDHTVPCASYYNGKARVRLELSRFNWDETCWFAAVRSETLT